MPNDGVGCTIQRSPKAEPDGLAAANITVQTAAAGAPKVSPARDATVGG
jgi:hypothetical protein